MLLILNKGERVVGVLEEKELVGPFAGAEDGLVECGEQFQVDSLRGSLDGEGGVAVLDDEDLPLDVENPSVNGLLQVEAV